MAMCLLTRRLARFRQPTTASSEAQEAAQEAGLISRTWFHTGDTSRGNLGQEFGDVTGVSEIPPCPPVVVLVADTRQAQHHRHPPQRAPEPEHGQVRRVTLDLGTQGTGDITANLVTS